jgi:hypothetical protein
MRQWLQRIRGAVGMGLTWAAGWAPIGAVVGAVLHVLLPGTPIGLGSVVALNATTFAVLGFVGGTIFATTLRLTEGHHRFDELSLPRFAGWGAVGGLILGAVAVTAGLWGAGFGSLGAAMMGAATLLGAGSAAGSLALARRADDPKPLEAGAKVADAGLPETERRHLPGKRS